MNIEWKRPYASHTETAILLSSFIIQPIHDRTRIETHLLIMSFVFEERIQICRKIEDKLYTDRSNQRRPTWESILRRKPKKNHA